METRNRKQKRIIQKENTKIDGNDKETEKEEEEEEEEVINFPCVVCSDLLSGVFSFS